MVGEIYDPGRVDPLFSVVDVIRNLDERLRWRGFSRMPLPLRTVDPGDVDEVDEVDESSYDGSRLLVIFDRDRPGDDARVTGSYELHMRTGTGDNVTAWSDNRVKIVVAGVRADFWWGRTPLAVEQFVDVIGAAIDEADRIAPPEGLVEAWRRGR